MPDLAAQIAENVARVRQRIAEAAARSGRRGSDITLVAVTKYVSADAARALVAAGCHDLGESRPQQLWEKAAALAGLPIRWHLIGHLQRNKIRRTLPLVAMIQSVDSPRLLAGIEEEAAIEEGRVRQSSPLPWERVRVRAVVVCRFCWKSTRPAKRPSTASRPMPSSRFLQS